MCNFLSGLVLKNGDIITDPEHTDSHEDLIEARGLNDNNTHIQQFARFEFVPKSVKDTGDVGTYKFSIDEDVCPAWFDEDMEANVVERLKDRISHMIITDSRKLLLGGCWIFAGEAKIRSVKNARIASMHDSSRIEYMHGSSRIDRMYGSSRIDRMYGSSRIEYMHGSSRIDDMYGSSRIDRMYGSSRIDRMYGSSRIEYMHGSSRIDDMYGSSRIDRMHDSSRIVNDYRNKSDKGQ